jgi:hypothetical protein
MAKPNMSFAKAHKMAFKQAGLDKVKPVKDDKEEIELDDYFFVKGFDPDMDDEDLLDTTWGGKYPITPEGLQKAMAELEEVEDQGYDVSLFNIFRRPKEARQVVEAGGVWDEDELIEDPTNYQFPNKK